MLATYSGTKAFMVTFTSALAEEVRAHNIIVQNLNTYFVVCVCIAPFAISFMFTVNLGVKNVQDPEIVSVDTHSCRLRPFCPEQGWPLMRSSYVRPTWYHHPILESRLVGLCYPCRWVEILVHLSFAWDTQRYPSSGIEEVGA